jgi:hypothetical protein
VSSTSFSTFNDDVDEDSDIIIIIYCGFNYKVVFSLEASIFANVCH